MNIEGKLFRKSDSIPFNKELLSVFHNQALKDD